MTDLPGGTEAIRRFRKAEIEQACVGPVPVDLRDASHAFRRDREHLMPAGFECDSQRFTQNPVIVTKDKPHRPRSFWPTFEFKETRG
jgi:hypothetical protein